MIPTPKTDLATATAWLAEHPTPWTVKRAHALTGAEYDVVDANGRTCGG